MLLFSVITLCVALLLFISIAVAVNVLVCARNSTGPQSRRQTEELKSAIAALDKGLRDELMRNREESYKGSKDSREELANSLEKMRETVEARLKSIQDETGLKLEKMRETVDEKLHKTLETRLGESFKLVSERLEQVHKGLGEMQGLAAGVGDLKRVLSNVKTRGIHGEILLGNLLEQILSPEQYARNIATKKGCAERVEFAIKLPGRDSSAPGQEVYLPIDSKFPLDSYQALQDAYDSGNPAAVEEAAKTLEERIKKCARDIREKYIDPPNTTDFGVMFLPYEGLYAEVTRRKGLLETLQNTYKIMVAGPANCAAFLNSLQMGFKTLAIEKQSSEVWKLLGSVKTEFGRFAEVLKKTQERLKQADEELDKLVGTRTNQIIRALRAVQEIPSEKTGSIPSGGAEDE